MPGRVAGRLLTGSLAFALAGAIDWAALGWQVLWARAHGRKPWL